MKPTSRKWSRILVQVLATWVLMIFSVVGSSAAKTKSGSSPIIRFNPSFPVSGMTAIPGDRLLIWHRNGQAQLRDAQGDWSKVFHLLLQKGKTISSEDSGGEAQICELIPDEAGMLILKNSDQHTKAHVVLLVNPDGKLLDSWQVPSYVFGISSNRVNRTLTTPAGIVPLLPEGRLGSVKPYPLEFRKGSGYWNMFIQGWRGGTVFCQDGNISRAHHAPIRCQRAGEGGWQFSEWGRLAQLPACGAWLMMWAERPEKKFMLYSLDTGELAGRKTLDRHLAMACGGPEGLWVGGETLRLLSLPNLKSRWQWPKSRRQWPLKGMVVATIALLQNHIAFEAEDELGERSEIVLLPRPGFPDR